MILARVLDGHELHGAEGAEPAESLADGALAQVEPDHEVVKGQRLPAAVEQAVDLTQGSRQGKDRKGTDKEVDRFLLEGGERLWRRGGQRESLGDRR